MPVFRVHTQRNHRRHTIVRGCRICISQRPNQMRYMLFPTCFRSPAETSQPHVPAHLTSTWLPSFGARIQSPTSSCSHPAQARVSAKCDNFPFSISWIPRFRPPRIRIPGGIFFSYFRHSISPMDAIYSFDNRNIIAWPHHSLSMSISRQPVSTNGFHRKDCTHLLRTNTLRTYRVWDSPSGLRTRAAEAEP